MLLDQARRDLIFGIHYADKQLRYREFLPQPSARLLKLQSSLFPQSSCASAAERIRTLRLRPVDPLFQFLLQTMLTQMQQREAVARGSLSPKHICYTETWILSKRSAANSTDQKSSAEHGICCWLVLVIMLLGAIRKIMDNHSFVDALTPVSAR